MQVFMAAAQEGSGFYVQGNHPPGYRFKPTEKELLYYLNLKILNKHIPIDAIKDVDLYQYHPHDLCQSTRDGKQEGYFFTSRTKKYRKGGRPDRTASDGYWKATGGDVIIESNGQEVGRKKVLVYYERKSENNKGTKTDWIMHEFTIHQRKDVARSSTNTIPDDKMLDECVCRIYYRTSKSSKDKEQDMIPIQETDANLAAASMNDDQYPSVHEPVTYMHGDHHMAMESNYILQSPQPLVSILMPDDHDQIISNDPNLIPTHEPAGMQSNDQYQPNTHMDGDLVGTSGLIAANSTSNDDDDDDDDYLDLTTIFDSSAPEMGPNLLDSRFLGESTYNAQLQSSSPIQPGQSITIHDMEGGSGEFSDFAAASISISNDGDYHELEFSPLFRSFPAMDPSLLDSLLVEYSSTNAQSQSSPINIQPAGQYSITIHDMEMEMEGEVGGSASWNDDDGDNFLALPSSSIKWPLGTWISHLLQ